MMESTTQDQEAIRTWMQNTQHAEDMGIMMRKNHDFMQEMMMEMINDPNIILQMLGHMSENPEVMGQMQEIIRGNMMDDKMMHP
ncbi:hypothetical protein [Nitrosopumilus sp.]|uniref:hypothetical protein n=1 Tax=Nitrosopumilus sp. TaxID=2024843 RepID=UPI00247CF904|nr:hypothetical protein [Nitrosopumilus sp.]MCV0411251.1 hypothetical protein [Nitrosopumilus sp.]